MAIHHFDTKEAEKYGIESAVILYNIRHWLEKNKANDDHIHDGFYWTYNSAKAFSKLFPYMTKPSITRYLSKLVECGLLKTGNYNKAGFDRTIWYTIPSEYSCESSNDNKTQNEPCKTQNEPCKTQNEPTIPDNKTQIINTDLKQERDAPEKIEAGVIEEPVVEVVIEKPVKVEKEKPAKFIEPTLDEVIAYVLAESLNMNAETFYYHYANIGWMVGKHKMKNWHLAAKGWASRQQDFAPKQTTGKTTAGKLSNGTASTKFEMPEDWKNDESVLNANAIDSTATTFVSNFFLTGEK